MSWIENKRNWVIWDNWENIQIILYFAYKILYLKHRFFFFCVASQIEFEGFLVYSDSLDRDQDNEDDDDVEKKTQELCCIALGRFSFEFILNQKCETHPTTKSLMIYYSPQIIQYKQIFTGSEIWLNACVSECGEFVYGNVCNTDCRDGSAIVLRIYIFTTYQCTNWIKLHNNNNNQIEPNISMSGGYCAFFVQIVQKNGVFVQRMIEILSEPRNRHEFFESEKKNRVLMERKEETKYSCET